MKINQNASFSATVTLDGAVVRQDAIERLVLEFRKFLTNNAKDDHRVSVSVSTRQVNEDDDWN